MLAVEWDPKAWLEGLGVWGLGGFLGSRDSVEDACPRIGLVRLCEGLVLVARKYYLERFRPALGQCQIQGA